MPAPGPHGRVDASAPSAPTGLVVGASEGEAALSWTAATYVFRVKAVATATEGPASGQVEPVMRGGDTVALVGSDLVHTFTSTGSLVANEARTCRVLLVGGGGGGGSNRAGGSGGVVIVRYPLTT